jgi:hypothetical protein
MIDTAKRTKNNLFRFGTDEEKQMNASYIISVARKLGCCIFLLPEDILEVRYFTEGWNQHLFHTVFLTN